MTVEVQMASELSGLPMEKDIERWAEAVSRRLGSSGGEVCIRVVDADEGQALNARFRGVDKATNVLSFAGEIDVPELTLLGDIVICAPVVLQEAETQHKRVRDHFAHMVVHGMLHLHGYDHLEEEEAQVMENLEAEVLAGFGIAGPYQ